MGTELLIDINRPLTGQTLDLIDRYGRSRLLSCPRYYRGHFIDHKIRQGRRGDRRHMNATLWRRSKGQNQVIFTENEDTMTGQHLTLVHQRVSLPL